MVTGRIWAGLVCLIACAAFADEGHDNRNPVSILNPPAELGASAVFAPDGSLWAASKEGGHVVVRRSADRGLSWSVAQRVNRVAEAVAADGDSRPKIAIGVQGDLYVTWTKPLSRPYTGDVRFSRSLDGGQHFDAPLTVHTDRQEITHRFDALAVNAEGKVFVAWIDKRDIETARKLRRDYPGAAVYVAISSDRGASFAGDRRIADHSCECCRIALLPRPDGSVLALWRHVFPPNVRDHALAKIRPDGSADMLQRATFDNWRIDACPHHGPGLAADASGQLHAVWFSGGSRSGVFYGRLGDGRIGGQRRVGGDGAAHADIAADGRRILIVWKQFDGQQTQLRAEVSDDHGVSWQPHLLATTAQATDQPRALFHDGRFLVFWHGAERPFGTYELP